MIAFLQGMKEGPRIFFTPLAFILSWFYWALGHVAYLVMSARGEKFGWTEFWYPYYNDWMMASSAVQDWAHGENRFWPWGGVEK